jgi:hypothetical protein
MSADGLGRMWMLGLGFWLRVRTRLAQANFDRVHCVSLGLVTVRL